MFTYVDPATMAVLSMLAVFLVAFVVMVDEND